ncbi:MAG: hypothetical protein RR185_09150, partial [Angelakisella sp.]
MKKTNARILSLLAAIGLTVSLTAGCGSKPAVPPSTASGTTSASSVSSAAQPAGSAFNAEGLPIMKEPTPLKVLTTRWGSMGDSFTKNQFLIDLEKSTNVKPEWQIQSLNDWGDQKNIMLASQELPDVILGSQTFGDQEILNNLNLFLDMTSLIEQYMPNLKGAM